VNIFGDLLDKIKKGLSALGFGKKSEEPVVGTGGGRNTGDQRSTPRQPKGPASINFGKFLLVRMPPPKSASPNFADSEEIERFANEVAEQIKQAFATHKINNYVHVEIYPTAGNSLLFKRYCCQGAACH
jgi:hypothetical protein